MFVKKLEEFLKTTIKIDYVLNIFYHINLFYIY